MSNIGPAVPLPPASAIPTYSPLGKPVVGNENAHDKDRALPPVEQGEAAERSRNRVESKPQSERRDRQPGQSAEQNRGDDSEESIAVAPVATAGQPSIRILPDGHAEPMPGRAALDAFNQVTDTAPCSLLDQRA